MPRKPGLTLNPRATVRSNRIDDRLDALIQIQTNFIAALTELVVKLSNPERTALTPAERETLRQAHKPPQYGLTGAAPAASAHDAAFTRERAAQDRANQEASQRARTAHEAQDRQGDLPKRLVPRGTVTMPAFTPEQQAYLDSLQNHPDLAEKMNAWFAEVNAAQPQDEYETAEADSSWRTGREDDEILLPLENSVADLIAEAEELGLYDDEPNEPPEPTDADYDRIWTDRLSMFRMKLWQSDWGPAPGKQGCQVPDHLLNGRA